MPPKGCCVTRNPRRAQVADGVEGLPVSTSLLQRQGCAPGRSHLGQGECHSQGGGTPLPATLSCLERPLEQREGGDPQGPTHFAHEASAVWEVLMVPPILARLGEHRSQDGVIAQLLTVSQRDPFGPGEDPKSRGAACLGSHSQSPSRPSFQHIQVSTPFPPP